MNILSVKNLSKSYKKFKLENVSFELDMGYIMGFIGANGAGKTTTIKSILNLINQDSGKIKVLGKEFKKNEDELKQEIGFIVGDSIFYEKRKVKKITSVVKRFYNNWDNLIYDFYIKKFDIDENKRLSELSTGMKVKYSITLALSYNAKLLILDEPTSGLDPVARDSMLDLFQELVEDGKKSILFSTHITSDLEKCADYITYINKGKIVKSCSKDDFLESYRLVSGAGKELEEIKESLISYKLNSFGYLGLINTSELDKYPGLKSEVPTIEDVMIYHAKREERHEKPVIQRV